MNAPKPHSELREQLWDLYLDGVCSYDYNAVDTNEFERLLDGLFEQLEAAQHERDVALRDAREFYEQREDVLRRLHATGVAYDPHWNVAPPTQDSSPASRPEV